MGRPENFTRLLYSSRARHRLHLRSTHAAGMRLAAAAKHTLYRSINTRCTVALLVSGLVCMDSMGERIGAYSQMRVYERPTNHQRG